MLFRPQLQVMLSGVELGKTKVNKKRKNNNKNQR
jgi:hypothetical protein